MADWLADHGVTNVAQGEHGGVVEPIYSLLDDRFAVMVGNSRHTNPDAIGDKGVVARLALCAPNENRCRRTWLGETLPN